MNDPGQSNVKTLQVFAIITSVFFALASVLSGCGIMEAPPDAASDFPTQPIKIIVGFGEGGGSDRWARSIGQAAKASLGVPVEVVNVEGDGGLEALRTFQEAPADGYTLFSLLDTYAAAYAAGETDVNPGEDLTPLLVGSIAVSQIYIAADDERFNSWDEVVAYAQENPGLTVSSGGTPLDLEDISIMNLGQAFDIVLERVILNDAQERFTAPLTGRTDLLIEQTSDVKDLVNAGELQPVLTLWDERIRDSEDVPAVGELDVDFTPLLRFRGLAAHNETPQARLDFLERALREAFNSEEYQAILREGDLDIVPYPDDPVAAVRQQVETYEAFNKSLKTED